MIQTARSAALDVLIAVSKDDAYANILLPTRIAAAHLDGRDAGLATELCNGTLRGRDFYRAVIGQCTDREISKIHPVVLSVLEMGVHQHVAMRVSTHALVNESVNLVKASGMSAASGFTNAVMRRVTERSLEQWQQKVTENLIDETDRTAVLNSHPAWIVRALSTALNADNRPNELGPLLAADNSPGPLGIIDLRNDGEALHSLEPARFSPLGFHLVDSGNPNSITTPAQGRIRVQDEGSQLAALMLAEVPVSADSKEWLDMCAAPGGKSAVLAWAAENKGAHLTSNELNAIRLPLVKNSLAPWPNLTITNVDGREFGKRESRFSRILVDAPCTGLGALRRRPEARWRKTPADVAQLTGLQEELLLSAIDTLEPGGVVAYVTCSPHIAETRGVVSSALKKRPTMNEIDARDVLRSIVRNPIDITGDALSVQLWPHAHGTDAMFIALMRKDQ